MQLFCVKPTVHYFETFPEFLDAFSVGEGDLIFTEQLLYEQYIRPCEARCLTLLKDQYGMGEPREEVIDAILEALRGQTVHRVIAVGGGSVIDIAKLLCVKNASPVRDVMEGRTPPVVEEELIVVPATCGTGSEVTFGGIVTMRDTGFKTGILAPELSAAHAVLIPQLLSTLPAKVFLHCSVDALGHAMESSVSATRGNEMARAVGARAIRLLTRGYAVLAQEGEQARPRLMKDFLTASCLAGMAVNNGGAGPVHALAYPVGETYHMSHGETIYQFLTAVFSLYERRQDGPLLEELRELIQPALRQADIFTGDTFGGLQQLLERIYPSRRLGECGMTEADVEPFTANVFAAKQRLLQASYVPFSQQDAMDIYRQRL